MVCYLVIILCFLIPIFSRSTELFLEMPGLHDSARVAVRLAGCCQLDCGVPSQRDVLLGSHLLGQSLFHFMQGLDLLDRNPKFPGPHSG